VFEKPNRSSFTPPHAQPADLSQLGIMDVAGLTDAVDAMALVSVPERCGSNKENIHRLALAQGANDPYKVCVCACESGVEEGVVEWCCCGVLWSGASPLCA
jgi:hypothetical protein